MSATASEGKIQYLTIGLGETAQKELASTVKGAEAVTFPYDLEKLLETPEKMPALILCGPPPAEIPIFEVAQTLRMNYPSIPMYLLVEAGARFDRKAVVKNGFTDVFFLPLDRDEMLGAVTAGLSHALKTGVVYKSVKLIDLKPETVLDFDTYIYLPANNKHIKYSNSGQSLEAQKLERLKEHKTGSVFVSTDDLPKFYEYTATALKALGDDKALSQTERNERLRHAVRDIITGLFSDVATTTDEGRKVVEDCQNIVRSYISTNDAKGTLYEKILKMSSDSDDSYSHITNSSTFAALFTIALGYPTAEEIALAGLLHDVGLSRVPLEVQRKPEAARSPQENDIYQRHPDESIAIIKERKLVVPDLVYKIIQQHHERFDGTGYPKKPPGARLCPEAQILSFADRFDEFLTVIPGQPRMTPSQAAQALRAEARRNPGRQWIEPELLNKLLALFPEEELVKSA